MVKKGEKGIPRSAETRAKIGIGARNTRLSEKKPCPYGCEETYNSGNMSTHIGKHHTFKCKVAACNSSGKGKSGLGYCQRHYAVHAFCVKVGTTIDEYFRVYVEQGGKCKLCPKEGTLRGLGVGAKVEVLVIDHCHETGTFRGLLCHSCNIALGHFKDDITVLENAIDYLRNHNDLL